ncbi:MAG: hypothetical protein K2F94_10320, partial [Muribaculaceae bacterium]|nr:hypothetical protein [Muribaculaceae bacterium]
MKREKIRFDVMCGLVAVLAVMACACSTTRRLGQGETRYTGVGDFDIIRSDNEKLPVGLVDNLKEASNCDANDYIFAPFIKIPLGLWVYNNWNDSAKGLKGWLYDRLAKPNVPISEVRPEMRVKLMEQILDNNGYFGSTASYSIDYSEKNKRKASIDYTLNVSRPYRIDSIIYFNDPKSKICGFIDSVAKKSPYLQKGEVFCVDSLSAERVRIANRLRNRGYYYFRPEYVEFLADSLITPGSIAIKMTLADNMPQMARTQYRTGKIVTTVLRKSDSFAGTPDTVQTPKGEVIVMRPAKLRKNLIPSCITFRPGKLFSVRDMDRTQTRLSRLGIFGNIQIQPVPADTSAGNTLLDVYNIV